MKLGLSKVEDGLVLGAGLPTRLAWVIGLRLVLLLVLFAGITAFYLRSDGPEYTVSQRVIFWALGCGFGLAAVYAYALRRGRKLERLAYVQLVLDQATWTAFVYVSGGPASGAVSFYALTALLGAILIGRRGAIVSAASGLAIYALLCAAFLMRWVLPPADQAVSAYPRTLAQIAYPFLLNTLGIVVVALLAGYLADRLRAAGGRLELAEERAVAAERLATLGRVAAGLAHEIRNPLGSIRGSIELLKDSPALGEEDRALCEIVQREATRLETLVSDMMDLSKPRRPKPETVSIARLAQDVVALAATQERSGAGDVGVRYEGPETGAMALCDGAQIRQVLWNLVRNAVQVSAAGKEVRVVVHAKDREVTLTVLDEGDGIPEAHRDKLFDAFYTTRTKGAGLGLAVVKRIVDDHAPFGARLDVRNREDRGDGQGAEFHLKFRASEGADSLLPPAPSPVPPATSS